MSATQNTGGLVISLDFELHWGVRDRRTVDEYRQNLLGVRQAIPAILDLFGRYGIHATWATVGFLFCESIDELKAAIPDELPCYRESNLDPYARLSEVGRNEEEDPFHFAPTLIRSILSCPGQEIGTHTLSHFYALAPGPTLESFQADLRSAKSVAARHGVALRSIVFPRNQISRQHLSICAEEGLIAYRSTEADPWIEKQNGISGRAIRFADSYFPFSGDGCATPRLDPEYRMVSVSGSRFLRPWNPMLQVFDGLRLRRICASMNAAAETGKLFHLWWHPHNFGVHLDRNMAFLARIADHYAHLNRTTGWPSLSMAEVAENVMRAEKLHCLA
jgi:peptidoglycan/xylan/chitin deacetylase (PgdA/CDA1 family)